MRNFKTITLVSLGILLISILSFRKNNQSDDKKVLAKVMIIEGKYVFIGSTPLQPYETAFEYTTVVRGMGCPTISEMANASVKSAMKKGFPFDAIILGDTKFDLAIKFK